MKKTININDKEKQLWQTLKHKTAAKTKELILAALNQLRVAAATQDKRRVPQVQSQLRTLAAQDRKRAQSQLRTATAKLQCIKKPPNHRWFFIFGSLHFPSCNISFTAFSDLSFKSNSISLLSNL